MLARCGRAVVSTVDIHRESADLECSCEDKAIASPTGSLMLDLLHLDTLRLSDSVATVGRPKDVRVYAAKPSESGEAIDADK